MCGLPTPSSWCNRLHPFEAGWRPVRSGNNRLAMSCWASTAPSHSPIRRRSACDDDDAMPEQLTSDASSAGAKRVRMISIRQPRPPSLINKPVGGHGGFSWSSQHLDLGGADGQASRVDDGVDGAVPDEVARSTLLAA